MFFRWWRDGLEGCSRCMTWRQLNRLDWRVGARSRRVGTMGMQMERMWVHSDAVTEVWGMRHVGRYEVLGASPKDTPQRNRCLESIKRFEVCCVCLFLVSPT